MLPNAPALLRRVWSVSALSLLIAASAQAQFRFDVYEASGGASATTVTPGTTVTADLVFTALADASLPPAYQISLAYGEDNAFVSSTNAAPLGNPTGTVSEFAPGIASSWADVNPVGTPSLFAGEQAAIGTFTFVANESTTVAPLFNTAAGDAVFLGFTLEFGPGLDVTVVPEPGTAVLVLVGLAGIRARRH